MGNLTELTKIPTELKISPTEVKQGKHLIPRHLILIILQLLIHQAFILYPTGTIRRHYAVIFISIDIGCNNGVECL